LAGINNKPAAAAIYREFLYAPGQERYTAIVGLGSAGNADDVVKMVNVLGDKDVKARGAALEALAKNRHAVVANEIVARLGKADAAARPWLLRALLGQQDKRAKQFMVEAAGSEDAAVRLAGLQGLAQVGDASAVPVLLKSAMAKGEEQAAARAALDTLAGKEIDAALLERLSGGESAQRVEVIRTLGARLTKDAVGPLFDAVKDADASVRGEAYKSLALVADVDALPRAVALVEGAQEDADRGEAVKAVVAIARKGDDADGRAGPVLSAAEKAEGPTKAALLNALGQLGGGKALAAVKGAIASDDAKVHEAGVRALVAWPDAGPAKDVLELARSESNNTLSILALRGYIRMVGLPSQRKAAETVKMLEDGMAVAKRNDE
jgi:HEAT repeat protein